jgi:hypothetical protein
MSEINKIIKQIIFKYLQQSIANIFLSHPNDIKLLKEIYDDLVESKVKLFYRESFGGFHNDSFIANKIDILITYFEYKSFLFVNGEYKKQLNTFIQDLNNFYLVLQNYNDYKTNIGNASELQEYTNNGNKLRKKSYESFYKLYKTCLKNITID